MQEHHLTVPCTARYLTLGTARPTIRDVWFVCHGYGQIASRFLTEFEVLDDGQRYIVAPEALSRYYTNHARREVGASWMTGHDRLAAIDDYVRYLDRLHDHVFQSIPRSGTVLTVVGFSQGGATAARWISLGRAVADRLVLWGELLPPDLDLEMAWGKLEDARLTFVVGKDDRYVDREQLSALEERLLDHEIPYETIEYGGGHWIDQEVLKTLMTS
jgi:predicted esterase